MERTFWQGFLQPVACDLTADELCVTFKDGSSARLPVSDPDFAYCQNLISRHQAFGLPVWVRGRETTILQARFARSAAILQFTPEPLGGAFLLFSDSPHSQYLPDTHPERERLFETFARAFNEQLPVLYALEEDGLIAGGELLVAPVDSNGVSGPLLTQQAPI